MFPYYVFLSVLLILLSFYKKTKDEKYYIAVFIVILIFAGFRGNGSGDYFHYLEYSKNVNSIVQVFNFDFPMELGFRIISYVKNILFLPDQTVILCMALLSILLTYLLINECSSNKILSIIIFLPILLQFDMHASRSAIAASAGCLALHYYNICDYKHSSLYFLIGIMFHKSIMVVLLFIIVKFLFDKVSKNKYIFISSIIIIISIFISLKSIILFLANINILESNFYIIKLSSYFLREQFSYPIKLYDPRILLSIGIFVLSLICLYVSKEEKKYRYFSYVLFINIFITMIFKDSTFLAYRLNSFFDRNVIFILPCLLSFYDNLKLKDLKYNFINLVLPYKNVLFGIVYILYYIALVEINMVPYYFNFI